MTDPTVSAVITTYNYARFIEGALDSVLGQTRPPDEIIVVDDGSTDDTEQRVAAYLDRGVRYVRKENGGAGSARNRGIEESRGDLICFLDADDRWLPEKTALQLEHFRLNPEVGLVTGGEIHTSEAGEPTMQIERSPLGAASLHPLILIENSLGNPSTVMVRRHVFDCVGTFDEGLRLGQDWEMWIRIARDFPVGVVDRPLITYVRHAHSLTADQVWQRYASNRLLQRRYIVPITDTRTRLRLLLGAQSMNCYYVAAALADYRDKRGAAFGMALCAALLDPFYRTRLKVGVLLRAALGTDRFGSLRSVLRFTRSSRG